MAEQEAQGTDQGQQSEAFSRDDVMQLITSETDKVAEKFKTEIAGLNRRNSELEKLLKEKDQTVETTKLTAEERLAKLNADLEHERTEREKWQRETRIKDNRVKAMEKVSELGLPTDAVDLLNLADDESMAGGLERLKAMGEKLKAQFADEYARGNGSNAPKGGKSVAPKTKRKSEMTFAEANAYKLEHGPEAYESLQP